MLTLRRDQTRFIERPGPLVVAVVIALLLVPSLVHLQHTCNVTTASAHASACPLAVTAAHLGHAGLDAACPACVWLRSTIAVGPGPEVRTAVPDGTPHAVHVGQPAPGGRAVVCLRPRAPPPICSSQIA